MKEYWRVLQNETNESINITNTTVAPAPAPSISPALIELLKYYEDLFKKLKILQWEFLGLYAVMFLLSFILLVYLQRHKRVALMGDADAARKVILPAFTPLLWIVMIVSLGFLIYFIVILAKNQYPKGYPRHVGQAFTAGRNFIAQLVILFMFQRSVSIPALRRACVLSLLLAVYPILVIYYMIEIEVHSDDVAIFNYFPRSALIVFYLYCIIRPPARASKRTIREYSLFSMVYYLSVFVYSEYFNIRRSDIALNIILFNTVWTSFYPLLIFRILKADTEHWRGFGQRAVDLQMKLRQKKKMTERISSEGLHLLIEMHRKFIIDFAYLDILTVIGTGSTATVFKGVLRSKTSVAVKVYTPSEVTEEAVGEFSNEAALCGALQHPNIVTFHGMCVCPPNICLVFELCEGSLDDIMIASASRRSLAREQLSINLSYILDAARAVAYLHSFSPPLIHRDIKPANFLVDFNGVVKLTDFGESRELPELPTIRESEANAQDIPLLQDKHDDNDIPEVAIEIDKNPSINGPTLQAIKPTGRKVSCMTVRGTVDYMAPELMNGRAGKASYAEMADVYSLAITMWEILHPGKDKYPSNGSHLKVYEWVLEGRRPEFDDSTHPRLREIIENAWNADVSLRPSARDIVHILEELQEEIQAEVASKIQSTLPVHDKKTWKGKIFHNVFSGEDAIIHILEKGYADSQAEALRMGNALMDAGLIHHFKHSHPFEHSDASYYFEHQKINMCQPIRERPSGESEARDSVCDIPGIPNKFNRGRMDSDQTSVVSTSYSQVCSSMFSVDASNCSCSKLAQGFDRPKPSKSKGPKQRKSKMTNDNFLTAKLLPENEPSDSNDFEEF